MSAVLPAGTLTLAEFFALPPDDGVDRELIRGELRERPMTKRNRFHAKTEATLSYLLKAWLATQSSPSGDLYSGEVGCILRHEPASNVGIDVAFFSAATVAAQTAETTMLDGVPVLAVEILSPSDRLEDLAEKIELYLEVGGSVIWLVDPRFKTVTVYRSDAEPQLFNITQSLADQPGLSGLQLAVKDIFE